MRAYTHTRGARRSANFAHWGPKFGFGTVALAYYMAIDYHGLKNPSSTPEANMKMASFMGVGQ